MTERDRLIAHEAGHAAAAVLLKATPTAVEIRDDGGGVFVPLDLDAEGAHDALLIALAGRIGGGEPDWPPRWPPREDRSNDERQAAILAGYLDLDRHGWGVACEKAWKLAASRPFTRLERAFADAHRQYPRLDAKAIDAVIGDAMQHLMLKATITPTTDQGTFTAVISSEAVDRERDVVLASAMVDALTAWGRPIPLAWEHSLAPDDIIGSIDPATVHKVKGEVVADGQVDLDTPRGQQAWRLMKARTLAFSFGYMTTDAVKRADGVREVRKLDVFEVSGVMAPMNNGTRVLATKAADDGPMTHAQLEHQLLERGLITRTLATTGHPTNESDVAEAERLLMTDVLTTASNGHTDAHHYGKTLAPWTANPDNYSSTEWAAACILDLADADPTLTGAPAKDRWRLPIRRPGATQPAPAALDQATHDLVQSTAPTPAKRAAATRLLAAYTAAGIEAQDRDLLMLAGKAMTTTKSTAPLTIASFTC
jgi:HK97 family phage prohead protease